jgi:hypothetical protein
MRIDDNDVPHIQAQCAGCGFLFDMKFGNDCPACHHIGVKWARLIKCATCGDTDNVNGEPCEGCIRAEPTMESQRALHDDPAMKAVDTYLRWQTSAIDYPGRLCSPYAHTEGDQKDIAELDRMFTLEDKR